MTSTTPAAATGQWSAQGELPEAATWYGQFDNALQVGGDLKKVLVVAGADGSSAPLAKAFLFTPGAAGTAGTWTAVGQPPGGPRRLHSATVLDGGAVLVAGGTGGAGLSAALASCALYNAESNAWTATTPMKEARWGHAAVLTADHKVLVCGGYALRSADSVKALSSAELYDPDDKTWTVLKPMNDARGGHTAVRFPDGRVLVVGGSAPIAPGVEAALAYCELWTPTGQAWTVTGNLTQPRSHHQMVRLSGTTALVLGGSTPGAPGDGTYDPYGRLGAEVYDLSTQKWRAGIPVPGGRRHHRAVPLGQGRVLVVGGTGGLRDAAGYQSALLYTAAEDSWAPVAGLATGRWGFAAVALSDTEALVAGGTVRSGLAAADPAVDDLTRTTELFRIGDGA